MSATGNEHVDCPGVSYTSVLCALDMRVCGLLAALIVAYRDNIGCDASTAQCVDMSLAA